MNEPNTQSFWRKGTSNSMQYADEYMALVNTTVPKMKAANPDCIVFAVE